MTKYYSGPAGKFDSGLTSNIRDTFRHELNQLKDNIISIAHVDRAIRQKLYEDKTQESMYANPHPKRLNNTKNTNQQGRKNPQGHENNSSQGKSNDKQRGNRERKAVCFGCGGNHLAYKCKKTEKEMLEYCARVHGKDDFPYEHLTKLLANRESPTQQANQPDTATILQVLGFIGQKQNSQSTANQEEQGREAPGGAIDLTQLSLPSDLLSRLRSVRRIMKGSRQKKDPKHDLRYTANFQADNGADEIIVNKIPPGAPTRPLDPPMYFSGFSHQGKTSQYEVAHLEVQIAIPVWNRNTKGFRDLKVWAIYLENAASNLLSEGTMREKYGFKFYDVGVENGWIDNNGHVGCCGDDYILMQRTADKRYIVMNEKDKASEISNWSEPSLPEQHASLRRVQAVPNKRIETWDELHKLVHMQPRQAKQIVRNCVGLNLSKELRTMLGSPRLRNKKTTKKSKHTGTQTEPHVTGVDVTAEAVDTESEEVHLDPEEVSLDSEEVHLQQKTKNPCSSSTKTTSTRSKTTTSRHDCLSCARTKYGRTTPQQHSSQERSNKPGEAYVFDTAHVNREPGIGGETSVHIATDPNTGYCEAIAVERRDARTTTMLMEEFIMKGFNRHKYYPSTIRMDKGGEYYNDQVRELLRSVGCMPRYWSLAKSPHSRPCDHRNGFYAAR